MHVNYYIITAVRIVATLLENQLQRTAFLAPTALVPIFVYLLGDLRLAIRPTRREYSFGS